MDNYLSELDKAAEALAATVNSAENNSCNMLVEYLEQKHDCHRAPGNRG